MALEKQAEQQSVTLAHYATKAEVSQLEVRLVRDISDVKTNVANLGGEIKALRGEFRLLLAGIGIFVTVVAVVLRFWPF